MARFRQPIFEGMLIILLGIMGIFRIFEGIMNAVYWNKIMLYMLLMIFLATVKIGTEIFMEGISKRKK